MVQRVRPADFDRAPPHRRVLGWLLVLGVSLSGGVRAEDQEKTSAPAELKKLSLEELMDVEVTSVSKRPERLSETASAIQVVTAEEIRRSGATRLPEALRLASNLAVAQLDSSQWAISARGFNGPLANKLLVLIDGRTVYSPLFAGVFWDLQGVFLEDVDRIEVISGPGGTLWGSNAVNGVINVITKSARETQGFVLQGAAGTELENFAGGRGGVRIGREAYLRVYGQYAGRDGTQRGDGRDINNDWRLGQGGFRLDWDVNGADLVTLQGDLYEARLPREDRDDLLTRGANLIGRWSHRFSEDTEMKLQAYVDSSHRDLDRSYDDRIQTYDLDFQHRFVLAQRHELVWGVNYRRVEDNFGPGDLVLDPRRISLDTFGGFVQDEIELVEGRLHLSLGSKLEHNDYMGLEFQPNIRLAWSASPHQTVWAAVSRVVRTPSRLDRDLSLPPRIVKNPEFDSEVLWAQELGTRVQVGSRIFVSLAGFYNVYDNLRSVEPASAPLPLPLTVKNGQEGESYGAELNADFQLSQRWRLWAGYTALHVDIRARPGSLDLSEGSGEAADSSRSFALRSSVDLPGGFELDGGLRAISRIENPTLDVPGYAELDLRLGWKPSPDWELSLVGQNLLRDRHFEFGDGEGRQGIERGVFGKLTWRN